MPARLRSRTRSAEADPSRLPTGIGPSQRMLDTLGQDMVQGSLPMTPLCGVLAHGRSMPPSVRWEVSVSKRRMAMRYRRQRTRSASLSLGPCAAIFPRDPDVQAAPLLRPRSNRTIWRILHPAGCFALRSTEHPTLTKSVRRWKKSRRISRMLALSQRNKAHRVSASI